MKLLAGVFTIVMLLASPMTASELVDMAVKNGFGVRALSMGGAQTAVANSDAGIFYNPAILANQNSFYDYEVMDFKKTTFDQWDVHRGKIGPFGFSHHTVRLPGTDYVSVLAIGFARSGNRGVDWGLTYKNISGQLDGQVQSGWSTDLGILAEMSRNINLGITLQDVVGEGHSIPLSVRVGATYSALGEALLLSSDVVYFRGRTDNQFEPHFGAEYQVANGLTLRGGWYDDSLTGGVNLIFPWIQLNYGVITEAKGKRETSHMAGFSISPPVK